MPSLSSALDSKRWAKTLSRALKRCFRSIRPIKVSFLKKPLGLSAKLTVPLILFIFPALLGALMLPAAARLVRVFGHGTPH